MAERTAVPWKDGHGDMVITRSSVADWVEKNIGAEFVEEALDKYDKINSGIPIGGFQETLVFLTMIEKIKAES